MEISFVLGFRLNELYIKGFVDLLNLYLICLFLFLLGFLVFIFNIEFLIGVFLVIWFLYFEIGNLGGELFMFFMRIFSCVNDRSGGFWVFCVWISIV